MTASSEQKNTEVRLWLLLRRVGDQLSLCEDMVYSKFGLTSEQFAVLGCIKSRGPLRPTDFALLLDRSPNSISMLVDRMVKAGLVRRKRDTKDRRVVFVSMTDKGREGIDQAAPAGWEFVQKVLSRFSYDEQRALANTLETVKCELVGYANPELDAAEICRTSITRDPNLYGRLVKNVLPPGREAGRKGRKKGKAD